MSYQKSGTIYLFSSFSNSEATRMLRFFGSYSKSGDIGEIAITSGSITEVELCRTIPLPTVKRTLQRLQETGFINVRVQKNTKTLVTVNRDAVLDLLRQPIAERLPSVSKKHFPFIDGWNEDIAKEAAQVAIENASADEGGKSGEVPDAG
jgi:hypothetical protein